MSLPDPAPAPLEDPGPATAGSTWAVVVNWNGGPDNLACISSILDQGIEEQRIAFVDNASWDRSRELVELRFPDLVYLDNETNEGFGHGANRGVRAALERGARAVLLVNNDVILPPGTLGALLAELACDPRLGVVGPRVLYAEPSDVIWAAGGQLTFRQNLSTLLGHGEPDGPDWQYSFPVDYVIGCAMLVKREVFETAGLFDGEYFAYHEDLEFCLQARAAGFGVVCAGAAAAYHDAHASTGGGYNPRRKYMMGVNSVWFLRRHGTPGRWLRYFVFDVLSLVPLWFREVLRGRGKAVCAKALGTWHGLRGRRVTAEILQPGATRLW